MDQTSVERNMSYFKVHHYPAMQSSGLLYSDRISITGVNHHDESYLVFRKKSIGSFQLFVLLFCFARLLKCNNPDHCNPQLQSQAHRMSLLACLSAKFLVKVWSFVS